MMAAETLTAPTFRRRWPALPDRLGERWRLVGPSNRVAFGLFAAVCLIALVGPLLAPHDPTARVGSAFLSPGTDGFWFGTDESGRDILSRVLFGTRSTWYASVLVIAGTAAVGALVGTIAGTAGGLIDGVLMRIVDLFLALPGPLLAIAIVAALGPSLRNTLISVAIVWWPWYARIVRNEVRAIAARPHVEAARLAGSRGFHLGRRHLFPGALPPLIVTATLDVGTLIVTLTALSFLGLGAPPPEPELGSTLASGVSYLLVYWWIPVIPSLAVTLLALAGNLVGDAARSLLEDR
jgi:peptide/nickel transport system permease protein